MDKAEHKENIDEVQTYVKSVLASFKVDPASSMYQAGYEAAVEDIQQWIYKVKDGETYKTRSLS